MFWHPQRTPWPSVHFTSTVFLVLILVRFLSSITCGVITGPYKRSVMKSGDYKSSQPHDTVCNASLPLKHLRCTTFSWPLAQFINSVMSINYNVILALTDWHLLLGLGVDPNFGWTQYYPNLISQYQFKLFYFIVTISLCFK